jgi:hypothetical protein
MWSALRSFCTVRQRDEVIDFFAPRKVDAAERTLAKAVDGVNDLYSAAFGPGN